MARKFRPEVVAKRVEAAVRILCRAVPTVVVFTLSDVSNRMPVAVRLSSRLDALNEAIRSAASDHGAVLVDLREEEAVRDLRYFGPDRLHLSEPGHRRLAAHLLARLGVPSDPEWLAPLPGAPFNPGLRAHAGWLWHEVRPVAVTGPATGSPAARRATVSPRNAPNCCPSSPTN